MYNRTNVHPHGEITGLNRYSVKGIVFVIIINIFFFLYSSLCFAGVYECVDYMIFFSRYFSLLPNELLTMIMS